MLCRPATQARRPAPDGVNRPGRRHASGTRRRRALPLPSPAAHAPWHFLNFLPDPHQHGSLRPICSFSSTCRVSTCTGRASISSSALSSAPAVPPARPRRGGCRQRARLVSPAAVLECPGAALLLEAVRSLVLDLHVVDV